MFEDIGGDGGEAYLHVGQVFFSGCICNRDVLYSA